MSEFRIGDRVICWASKGVQLTEGKAYLIEGIRESSRDWCKLVVVRNDQGLRREYVQFRFITVEEFTRRTQREKRWWQRLFRR